MNKLEEARKIINEVDKEVAALFQKRMQAVEDVIYTNWKMICLFLTVEEKNR